MSFQLDMCNLQFLVFSRKREQSNCWSVGVGTERSFFDGTGQVELTVTSNSKKRKLLRYLTMIHQYMLSHFFKSGILWHVPEFDTLQLTLLTPIIVSVGEILNTFKSHQQARGFGTTEIID